MDSDSDVIWTCIGFIAILALAYGAFQFLNGQHAAYDARVHEFQTALSGVKGHNYSIEYSPTKMTWDCDNNGCNVLDCKDYVCYRQEIDYEDGKLVYQK